MYVLKKLHVWRVFAVTLSLSYFLSMFLCILCTLCPKKVYPLMFDNNFGKFGPIFKIFTRGHL